jgi:hypothetical protein
LKQNQHRPIVEPLVSNLQLGPTDSIECFEDLVTSKCNEALITKAHVFQGLEGKEQLDVYSAPTELSQIQYEKVTSDE